MVNIEPIVIATRIPLFHFQYSGVLPTESAAKRLSTAAVENVVKIKHVADVMFAE